MIVFYNSFWSQSIGTCQNEGKFGNVVTLKGENMSYTSLEEVIGDAKFGRQKHVDPNGELVKAAKAIGICFGDE